MCQKLLKSILIIAGEGAPSTPHSPEILQKSPPPWPHPRNNINPPSCLAFHVNVFCYVMETFECSSCFFPNKTQIFWIFPCFVLLITQQTPLVNKYKTRINKMRLFILPKCFPNYILKILLNEDKVT